jgi:glyoxylase I family protein
VPRIEHFALFAADLAALKAFYTEAFDLRVLVDNSAAEPAGYFLGDDDGGVLELIARPKSEPPVNQRFVCHVAFQVDDVAETQAAFERRGLTFETETAVHTAAMHTAFFRDPEGNRCQIVWRQKPL